MKGGVRALSLLPVLTVMLLCCIADAGNLCFAECYGKCSGGCAWFNPVCYATCAGRCAIADTCNNGVNQNNERKQIDVNHYCKLGCVSSVCSVTTTILSLNSPIDKGEKGVKESMERCNNACSAVCTKHFNATVVNP